MMFIHVGCYLLMRLSPEHDSSSMLTSDGCRSGAENGACMDEVVHSTIDEVSNRGLLDCHQS